MATIKPVYSMIPRPPKVGHTLSGPGAPYPAAATTDVSALHGEGTADAVDAIDTTGVKSGGVDSALTFNIPTAAGGEGALTTIRLDADKTDAPIIAGGGSTIGIGFSDKTDAEIAGLIIKAINAVADTNILLANPGGTGLAGYDAGITAKEGSSDTEVTLTMDAPGAAGNLTGVLLDSLGTSMVDVASFTGGADETGYDESEEAIAALKAGYAADAAEAKKLEHARKVVLGYI